MRNYAKQVMRPGPKGPERVKDGPIVFFNSEDGPPPEANGSPSLWALWQPCPGGQQFRLVGEDSQTYKERTHN